MIVLEGQRPWVWRRLNVSPFTKLGGLHRIIQAVMGWEAELPHQFVLAGDIYDRVAPNEALPPDRERNWRLDSALYPNRELWYDVGRGYEWRHRITLENYLESVPHWKYPRCLDGAGASPSGAEKTFSIHGANRRLWRRHPRP
jgi:Plasmid pRiA4b ORF-3-like protein